MNKEFLYMQKLAGIITESEYAAKLNENQNVDNIIKNLSSTYDLSTFESFKDEIESSDLMDEIIAQMNDGVEPDYSNMNQDEINSLVNPIKKQVDDYVFKRFNKKIFNKTSFTNKITFPGNKNPLIDYNAGNISPDEVGRFGDYDEASNTFEIEQGSDAMADFYDDVYKGTNMSWWEDEDNAEDLSNFYTFSLEKAVKEKYGDDVNIEYY